MLHDIDRELSPLNVVSSHLLWGGAACPAPPLGWWVEQSCKCEGLFLGMVGEVPGSASRLREIQRLEGRGAQSAAAAMHAAWEAGGLPTRAAEEENHTRQVFAQRTRWRRRAIFGSAGGAGSTPRNG